jgi:hypothetical protein
LFEKGYRRTREKKYQRVWMYMESGAIQRTKINAFDENDEFCNFLGSETPVKDYLQYMRGKKMRDDDDKVYWKDREEKEHMQEIFDGINMSDNEDERVNLDRGRAEYDAAQEIKREEQRLALKVQAEAEAESKAKKDKKGKNGNLIRGGSIIGSKGKKNGKAGKIIGKESLIVESKKRPFSKWEASAIQEAGSLEEDSEQEHARPVKENARPVKENARPVKENARPVKEHAKNTVKNPPQLQNTSKRPILDRLADLLKRKGKKVPDYAKGKHTKFDEENPPNILVKKPTIEIQEYDPDNIPMKESKYPMIDPD